MNPVTFNNFLEQSGIVSKIKNSAHSPLFIHEDGCDPWKVEDYRHCFTKEYLPILPYDTCRLSLTSTDLDREFKTTLYCLCRKEKNGSITVVSKIHKIHRLSNGTPSIKWRVLENLYTNCIFLTSMFGSIDGDGLFKGIVYIYNTNSGLFEKPLGILMEYAKSHGKMVREYLSKFSIDWMNPHFFAFNVSPKAKEKSIEWVRQREHTILVHKDHPANNPIHKHGSVISSDNHQSMHRMAHSRRAHLRMLRSPKFKHKMGMVVFVKSTWVGPKEWEDNSGQIYRLVDKPKNNLTESKYGFISNKVCIGNSHQVPYLSQ